ncbi:GNAT family N-acetyltransferase [Vogesella oryzae]|uniref:GNAT family N-acetyltransferase n=1 Tax=Vogesella oryzae TaxID=1735285 RepID=UPI001582D076|nr:GNAT family N-acetyltransferase [Vogesella oryzae]
MFDPVLTAATPADAALLAGLHWRSWLVAYRGLLPDRYLDEQAGSEMVAKWQQRMGTDATQYRVCIARVAGVAAGFVCLQPGFAPQQGVYLDNLHVLPVWQGHGLGKKLLAWAAAEVATHWPGQALLLHVLDGNLPAREVYRRLGGIETKLPDETMAGDVIVPVNQVTWQDVPALLARLQS